ncbi:secretion-regulating guanine nucleotide exchange factor [Anopheles ziemanni]|uniref:secretion-regulating guanine nucleotide exchange factor n=1 Tax=Anopheles coustani TaxID=139045 RepID=UPI00265A87AB|nr:secretion-regulating guanine nucleotide exchange factor [Anopheles coustani]XP_058166339.1 secretion-regulating guanine nucleotide exchange factor [Anopheles ziemanni]
MFAWGANSHAQLGLGYASEQCDTPQQLREVPFRITDVQCVAAGGGHTLIGLTDGRLYGCGWNNRGQLGVGHTDDCVQFQAIGGFGFKHIAAGWDVSAGITAFGDLYVWGSNVWQQIAQTNVKTVTKPQKLTLPENETVVKVVFGLQYMTVLTDRGNVWVLGKCKFLSNDYPPDNRSRLLVRCLKDKGHVRDIASGDNHLVLHTEGKRILCLGDNKHGQCTNESIFPTDIIKLESGWTHSGCLTGYGEIYLWGRNNYGQLGYAGGGPSSSVPRLLELHDSALPKDMSLGSQHGTALTASGRVYCWGWNEHGNCGIGGVENVLVPTLVELPLPVSRIMCGAGYTLAFT